MANYYNKNLYKILNVTYEASIDDIKTEYRKLVRIYHPDISKNEADISIFKEIQEAYEILTDEEKRKRYDILHGFYKEKIKKEYNEKLNRFKENIPKGNENPQKKHTDNNFTSSINKALDNLFYGKKLSGKSTENKQPINGKDISIDLSVNFLESINGTNRKVNIIHTKPCPNCEGRKFINGQQCKMCNGQGELSYSKKINVKIPKGVYTGSKVRIRKEGDMGLYGGKDGDLYLIINVDKNPYYCIDKLNILINLPITPFEAVSGCEISVPLPDGNYNVKIPPLTSSGQKLKLTSLGLENKSKTKKGDVIITVMIKIPETLSEKEKELYNKLAQISKSDVRKDFYESK